MANTTPETVKRGRILQSFALIRSVLLFWHSKKISNL